MTKTYDYLIVGAGLSGSLFAYFATKKGKKCLVVDKRQHIGGNMYCENINGVNVHKYGAHIFHTSNKEVWDFVNSIVEFKPFINSPIAIYGNEVYNLPFNMNTFYQIFGVNKPEQVMSIISNEIDEYQNINGDKITNLEEQAISMVGTTIYEKLIKDYTEKQWGRKCTELPPEIIKRLPLRFTYDNNYFNDTYQGIPVGGYNKFIEGLLEGSDVLLNTDYFGNEPYLSDICEKIVFTGRIDEYFDYKYGLLQYRTVYWKTDIINSSNYQGNAVVNYTKNDVPYTRIIEHKHFDCKGDELYKNEKTVITTEYSEEWENGKECFYPINNSENNEKYKKYKELADNSNTIFIGRLANYKYYDMDDIIEELFNYKSLI